MTTKTKDAVKEAAARFARDTANHVMTIKHDDGLYRHLRFSRPDSSTYWFDIVTWPGSLVIKGDMGTYVFSRITDMFEFFRGEHINPGYWAEKTPDYGRSAEILAYDEDLLTAELEPHLTAYAEEYPDRAAQYKAAYAEYWATQSPARYSLREPVEPKTPDEIRELISDYDADGLLSHQDGARDLLKELEQFGVVEGTYEWDLRTWTFHYLWCCHALIWAIGQYDAEHQAAVTPVPA